MIDSQALLQSLSSHSLFFQVSMVVQLKSGSYKAQQAFCQGVTTLTSRITFNYLDNYIYFSLIRTLIPISLAYIINVFRGKIIF